MATHSLEISMEIIKGDMKTLLTENPAIPTPTANHMKLDVTIMDRILPREVAITAK